MPDSDDQVAVEQRRNKEPRLDVDELARTAGYDLGYPGLFSLRGRPNLRALATWLDCLTLLVSSLSSAFLSSFGSNKLSELCERLNELNLPSHPYRHDPFNTE